MPSPRSSFATAARRGVALTVALGLAATVPSLPAGSAPAAAAPALGGTFPLTAQPEQLTAGPDGNMWVALSGSTDDLAKVTPSGAITYYDLGGVSGLGALTVGPDQNLWATVNNGVVRIPPADPTNETPFVIVGFVDARGIDLGPDGNLWAASADKVFRISPANPVAPAVFTVPGMGAREVRADANRIWVVDNAGGRVVAFAPDGTFTLHTVGGSPQGIETGPAGQVLYTNPGANPQDAGRLTLGGTPALTPLAGTDPSFSVAFGLDAAYWVGLFLTGELARITPEGEVTRLGTFAAPANKPRYVAAGPGGTIWVSLQDPGNPGAIGLVSGLTAPVTDSSVTIKFAGKRATVRDGKANVRLRCPKTEVSGPCVGKLTLKSIGGKSTKLGSKKLSIKTGKTKSVKVRLDAATLRRVRDAGTLKVLAVVKVRDAAGNKKTVRKEITLVSDVARRT
jgi:streptogramin lyase